MHRHLNTSRGRFAKRRILAGSSAALALSASQGPGPRAASPVAFPLQSAMVSMLVGGYHQTWPVTGLATIGAVQYPVHGAEVTEVVPGANLTVFAGQQALHATVNLAGTLQIGSQAMGLFASREVYLSPAYALLGYAQASPKRYCVASGVCAYPAHVHMGDSGRIAVYACYLDSSLQTPVETETVDFRVLPDSGVQSALVELVTTGTAPAGQVLYTNITTYRIDATGALYPASSKVQDVTAKHPQGGALGAAALPSELDLHVAEP